MDDITNLVSIDFRDFKFSRIQPGTFHELYMSDPQYRALLTFLAESRPEIDQILTHHREPDKDDMEMMDVERKDVGYRSVTVRMQLNVHKLPGTWSYEFAFLTRKDGNPAMAFGDQHYSREQARSL